MVDVYWDTFPLRWVRTHTLWNGNDHHVYHDATMVAILSRCMATTLEKLARAADSRGVRTRLVGSCSHVWVVWMGSHMCGLCDFSFEWKPLVPCFKNTLRLSNCFKIPFLTSKSVLKNNTGFSKFKLIPSNFFSINFSN